MMNLTELKRKSAAELVAIAEDMGLDGVARSKKQDVISILKNAKKGENISGDGVWRSADGFGFLRSSDHHTLRAQTIFMFP